MEDEKRIAFASFMKTLTTFMVQAKNNDDDLRLLRDLLGSVLGDKDISRKTDDALALRLNALEKSLAGCTNLPDRLRNLEANICCVTSLSERIKLLDDRIQNIKEWTEGPGSEVISNSLLQRIERLESQMINDVTIMKRLELIENRLAGSNSQLNSLDGEIAIESDPLSDNVGIIRRVAQLEARVGAEAPVLKERLDAVESRLASFETQSGVVSSHNQQKTCTVIEPIQVVDLVSLHNQQQTCAVIEPIQVLDLCEEPNKERWEIKTLFNLFNRKLAKQFKMNKFLLLYFFRQKPPVAKRKKRSEHVSVSTLV